MSYPLLRRRWLEEIVKSSVGFLNATASDWHVVNPIYDSQVRMTPARRMLALNCRYLGHLDFLYFSAIPHFSQHVSTLQL
jgi:hypothetical protein